MLLGLGFDGEDDVEDVYDVVQRLDDEPAYDAAVTGEWTSDADQGELSTDDLRTGELFFGLPTALVILLLVFGSVVAGLVPMILAIVSIFVALGLAALLGQAYDLSLYTVNMLSAMGLALGIDYALFVVSRFREERAGGRERLDAIAAAGATASRAVLFSGMTFVLAMFGLVLVPSTIFRSLAAGAILVGIVSVLAALTLLPAVLGLLGDRIDALRIPYFGRAATESRGWGRVVSVVMRRPVVSLVLAAGFLVALALPVLGLQTGSQGPSALPDRFESKQGYVLLNEEFPGQTTDPVEIAVAGDAGAGIERLEAALARAPGLRRAGGRGERSSGRDPVRPSRSPATRSANARSMRCGSCARSPSRPPSPGPAPRSSSAATRPRSSTTTTRSTPGSRACSRSSSGSASCC